MKILTRFMFGTFRGRLILSVALVHAVMMSLFIVDLTTRQRDMLLDRQLEEATALSQALATSSAGWIAANDIAGLQELVDAQNLYPEIIFVFLADKDGRVLAGTDKPRNGKFMLDLPREAHLAVLSSAPSLVDVAVPAMIAGRHVGWARVGLGQKIASEKLVEVIRNGVLYTLAAIFIGSVIAWFMGHRITRRLYAIQETIDAVRSGNHLVRSALIGNDEAAVMAGEFNSMLDDLAERDAELRASEERYRQLFENSPLGIYRTTPAGRILASSPALVRMLGFTSFEELSTRNLEQGDADAAYSRKLFKKRIEREGRINGLEAEWRKRDGTPIFVRENVQAIRNESGAVLYYDGTIEDITERKQAERKLAQYSEHLEELVSERTRELRDAQEQLVRQERLAALGQLAGGIGHELRNPLGVISNAVYFLKAAQPDANDKVREYLQIIENETRTSDKIITDLLDFTRIKSVDREAVSVSELIRQTLERFPVPPIVDVTIEIADDLPQVFVDPRQMIQVLGNLIVNACQAMATSGVPKGGQLSLHSNAQNDMINIIVKDNGVGIPLENMPKLFEPLFTTKTKGIGLGLAVSKKLIEANGGRIEVESEPGKGSSFSVYLPIYEEPA